MAVSVNCYLIWEMITEERWPPDTHQICIVWCFHNCGLRTESITWLTGIWDPRSEFYRKTDLFHCPVKDSQRQTGPVRLYPEITEASATAAHLGSWTCSASVSWTRWKCPTGERVWPVDSVCPIESVLRVGSLKLARLAKVSCSSWTHVEPLGPLWSLKESRWTSLFRLRQLKASALPKRLNC